MMILAQQSVPMAPSPAPTSFLSLDTIFWFTVLAIFLITIFSAMLRRLVRDKALKLFHEYHVTFFSERRPTLWGDMLVSSQGIELLFDTEFVTRRKLTKSSALIYEDEFLPMIAVTRTIHALTEKEQKERAAQIQNTFRPGTMRRSDRWFRNLLNTMRDAISKTMTLVVGRFTGASGAALSAQANDINTLSGNVVGLMANAYEPLLERYIGQPVVLEILLPPPPGAPPPPNWIAPVAEFPGYLVDYTQKFIAVFNVDHTPVETLELTLDPAKPVAPELTDLKVLLTDQDTVIRCEGKDAFVLRQLCCNGDTLDLGIAMIPGTTVILAALLAPARLTVERTRHIDIIVPRTRGRIRFGAMPTREAGKIARKNWLGISPVLEPRELLQTLRESWRHRRRRDDDEPPTV